MDDLIAEARDRHGVIITDGLQVLPPEALLRRPWDPGMALLLVPDQGDSARPTAPAGAPVPDVDEHFEPVTLPGRQGHGPDAVAMLGRLYPADHPLLGLGGAPDGTVGAVTSHELMAAPHLIPALDDRWNVASPYGLPWLVAMLRAPGGCPWDREQDHLTLRPFLLEEAYEVYDALEAGSTRQLAEELGDLLLQIVLHAQYGAEAGVFDLLDVQRGITTKIIRRHPHVFGDVRAGTADEVIRNWERIKADERAAEAGANGASSEPGGGPTRTDGSTSARDPEMPGAFAGLSRSLPALAYAAEMQGRAAGLGYDWPDLEGVIDKIAEEASELLAATDAASRTEEYGDLLFVMVNLGRKMSVDPEAALRAASRKFASRFARVERMADTRGVELRALGLDGLDELWQEAKAEERGA